MGKLGITDTLNMLQKPDGSKSADIIEKMKLLIEQLNPENNTQNDTDQHRNTRRLTEQPIENTEFRNFPARILAFYTQIFTKKYNGAKRNYK
jgi:hypothetical protein